MKKLIILLTILLTGCNGIVKSGPFVMMEKYPDQIANLADAPSFTDCSWVIKGSISGSACDQDNK